MQMEDLAANFQYLDDLRASGATNMFGATPYLERDCGLSRAEARTVLQQWMATFRPGVAASERAADAIRAD